MYTQLKARVQAYDPFGEAIEGMATTAEGDRRARNAALAVFWTLALLLMAGRIYAGHIVAPEQLASLPVQVAIAAR